MWIPPGDQAAPAPGPGSAGGKGRTGPALCKLLLPSSCRAQLLGPNLCCSRCCLLPFTHSVNTALRIGRGHRAPQGLWRQGRQATPGFPHQHWLPGRPVCRETVCRHSACPPPTVLSQSPQEDTCQHGSQLKLSLDSSINLLYLLPSSKRLCLGPTPPPRLANPGLLLNHPSKVCERTSPQLQSRNGKKN